MEKTIYYLNATSPFWVYRAKGSNEKPAESQFKRSMTHVAVRKALKAKYPDADIAVMPPSKAMRRLKRLKTRKPVRKAKAA